VGCADTELGAVGWDVSEMKDMTALIKSNSDVSQANSYFSFLNSSFCLPGDLSREKKRNSHGPEATLLVEVEVEADLPAGELPRCQVENKASRRITRSANARPSKQSHLQTLGRHGLNRPLKPNTHRQATSSNKPKTTRVNRLVPTST